MTRMKGYTDQMAKLQIAANELRIISLKVDVDIVKLPLLAGKTTEQVELNEIHQEFVLLLERLDDSIASIEQQIQELEQ